ncbi:MAG: hypothetical protein JXB49_30505, partial [Bacteroidales bacterium]|nr:hypothetical protein [Bacteroidales bacterium]
MYNLLFSLLQNRVAFAIPVLSGLRVRKSVFCVFKFQLRHIAVFSDRFQILSGLSGNLFFTFFCLIKFSDFFVIFHNYHVAVDLLFWS